MLSYGLNRNERPLMPKRVHLPDPRKLGEGCSLDITDSRKIFDYVVLKDVDARRDTHVFQYGFLQKASTIIAFVDFDESEGKPGMDDRNGGERSALSMLREHSLESEVCDLVSVKGEECLIRNVAAYC